jgi:hypothetical protein
MDDVDGLNAGYARALLDDYLENPESVPSEWRSLFESGRSSLVATHPGIARLLETLPRNGDGAGNGHPPVAVAPPPPAAAPSPAPAAAPDDQLLGPWVTQRSSLSASSRS